MDISSQNTYTTETHNQDINFLFHRDEEIDENEITTEHDIKHDIEVYWRLLKTKWHTFIKERTNKNFTNIIYVTLDCPFCTPNSVRNDNPLEFIEEIRKQYPEYNIKILVPIIGVSENNSSKKLSIDIDGQTILPEKTSISFDFFLQNRIQNATVYKFPQNSSNITIYGIYSPIYSGVKNIMELSKLHFLAPFMKSVRIAIKHLSKEGFCTEIVHCENIPYYLGAEFEPKFPARVKVLQTIKDFTQLDMTKYENFWAAINLADKTAMQKICRDVYVKKYVAQLFNLHNTKRFCQMRECLNFIYKNYSKFRKYVEQGEVVEENLIFNRLNNRITQIFPNIFYKDKLSYNPMTYSFKKADLWAVNSKSYYQEIFDNPQLSGKFYEQISHSRNKGEYISIGCNTKNFNKTLANKIYQEFNIENFRDLRSKNKYTLLKEFSQDRIKTNFIDINLFKEENPNIVGYLDSFYDTPLLFSNPDLEIFSNGIDILFNTVMKLFECHKNVQIIIALDDGLKSNYVKSRIKFLQENKYLNGKWVFIDGKINPTKFYAASDMILIPRRINATNIEHLIAMHYGCVPIAARFGMLDDNIPDIFDDIANGCGFKTKTGLITEEDNNELFITPVMKALNIYQNNPNCWNILIKNCLNTNCDWDFKTLEKYHKIYQNLL